MLIVSLYPALVALVGLLTYAFAKDKPAELGRIAFFVGLLWLVATLAQHGPR